MLDDLRNSSSFIDEEEPIVEREEAVSYRPARRRKETFMGMTAQQRFFLSLMVFFMIFILGVLALVATGAIVLPF